MSAELDTMHLALHEERAKREALELVLSQLQDANISLQRKWHQTRETMVPSAWASPAASPPGDEPHAWKAAATDLSATPQVESSANGKVVDESVLAPPPSTARVGERLGWLHLRLREVSLPLGAPGDVPNGASVDDVFVCICVSTEHKVHSHKLAADGVFLSGGQAFLLPISTRSIGHDVSSHASQSMSTPDDASGGAASLCAKPMPLLLRASLMSAPMSGDAVERAATVFEVDLAQLEPFSSCDLSSPWAQASSPEIDDERRAGAISVCIEWRPMPDEATDGVPRGELGFPLSARGPRAASNESPTASTANGRSSPDAVEGALVALKLRRWNRLLASCTSLAELPSSTLRALLLSGVPSEHRGHVWEQVAGASSLRPRFSPRADSVHRLSAAEVRPRRLPSLECGAECAEVIERDLLRTFPEHPHFCTSESSLVPALRRVLRAQAVYLPDVGYCQGLNFIAGVLLLHCDEPTAWALLVTLCDKLLRGYHEPSMSGLHRAQGALIQTLQQAVPRVYGHLSEHNVPVKEYSTGWFLCCFIDVLQLPVALRVWDLLFSEGEALLLRATVALYILAEEPLMEGHDFDDTENEGGLLRILQCEPERLMRAACEPKLERLAAQALGCE
uniref:Rab-GAP TBC domain-containing protein n=1 Tax=Calcidiscus leptoporus TaxID=127549 RepID=A0A7S0J351_9EUKA